MGVGHGGGDVHDRHANMLATATVAAHVEDTELFDTAKLLFYERLFLRLEHTIKNDNETRQTLSNKLIKPSMTIIKIHKRNIETAET